jgi:predicted nucleic acid-binding protein
LPEVAYLLHTRIGADAELAFIRAVADREFNVEQLDLDEDLERVGELMSIYRDESIGLVDATVVAVAERMGVSEIATTDRRRFGVIRPRHVREFTLLP